jgi:glycosyltransferase involved in cell wall biosynthesis
MLTTRVVDLSWIPPTARGLLNSALANVELATGRTPSARMVLLLRRGLPFPSLLGVQRVDLPEGGLRLMLAREGYLARALAGCLLRGRRLEYVSWVPRLPIVTMLSMRRTEVFVHDLNLFRPAVYVPPFRQPGCLSRAHQHLSLRRAHRVLSFSRSVRRQVERCCGKEVELVCQRVLRPSRSTRERPGAPVMRAAMFVDDRAYKGAWCADWLYSSSRSFELVLIGTPRPALERALSSRGVRVTWTQCDDTKKWEVFQRCDFLLFASRYEGFGIPPREAGLLGVPSVIVRKAALLDVPRHLSIALSRELTDLDALAAQASAIPRDELIAWASTYAPRDAGAPAPATPSTPASPR